MPTLAPTSPLALEDIITPVVINSWPPAIGWWVGCFVISGLIVFTIFHFFRHQKKWGYRKEALTLLNSTMMAWQDKKINDEKIMQDLVSILKRTAISAYPQKNIESLYGQHWLKVLHIQAPEVEVKKEVARFISASQYQVNNNLKPSCLHEFCKEWICKHETQWRKETL